MTTTEQSWDTGEAILWLNNDEMPYHWARRVAGRVITGEQTRPSARREFREILGCTGAQVKWRSVDFDAVLDSFIDDLTEESN